MQRGVRRIIACVAAAHAPDTNASHWAGVQWDVASLFGAVPESAGNKKGRVNGMSVSRLNEFMQARADIAALGRRVWCVACGGVVCASSTQHRINTATQTLCPTST